MPRLPVTLMAVLLALPIQGYCRPKTPVQAPPRETEFITPFGPKRPGAVANRVVVSIQHTGSQDYTMTPILVGLSAKDVDARRYDLSNDFGIIYATGVVVSTAWIDALLAVVESFKDQVIPGDRDRFGDLTVTVYAPRQRPTTLLLDRATSLQLLARLKRVGNGFPDLQSALDEQVYPLVHTG